MSLKQKTNERYKQCGFQVIGPTVVFIRPLSVSPFAEVTYLYVIIRVWSCIFQNYLLGVVSTKNCADAPLLCMSDEIV